MSPADKKQMIRHDHPELSISQQCRLVRLSRSAFYYEPIGIDDGTLAVMTVIDKAFTRYPFFGSRRYNTERPHSALEGRTPRKVYRAGRDEKLAT